MIVAQASIVAGAKHPKYPAGTEVDAVFFVNTDSEAELQRVAALELKQRGWKAMKITRLKDVTNPAQFQSLDTPTALAHKDAVDSGFGIVVFAGDV